MGSGWKSPVKLIGSKADTYLFLRTQLHFSDIEIKELTTLQVNLYIQRYNEPGYKDAIDRAVKGAQDKVNG